MKFKPSNNVRQTLVATLSICGVAITSVHLFLANQPSDFSKWGGFIVVIALLSLSLHRIRYDNAVRQSKEDWFATVLNDHTERNFNRYESTVSIVNVHALNISRLARATRLNGDAILLTSEQEREIRSSMMDGLTSVVDLTSKTMKLDDKLEAAESEYESDRALWSGWAKFYLRLEVAFVTIGTIQNAYGADLVTWYHAR